MAKENNKKIKIEKIDSLIEDAFFEGEQNQPQDIPEVKVKDHTHNGNDSTRIRVDHLTGFLEVVSVAPTHIPKNMFEQIKLYVNGTTYRIYFYDYKAKAWRYA